MSKNVIVSFSILAMIPALTMARLATKDHLASAKRKYPFSLIGNDFGILNEQDLASNTCTATPMPFSKDSQAFPYWQCFETKSATFVCEKADYDESEKAQLAIMAIDIHGITEDHTYVSRRAIHLDDCRSFQQDWKKLTKGQKYVCLSGPFTEYKLSSNGKRLGLWTFDKFKTKKGCSSYFFGGCDLHYQLGHGCHITHSQSTTKK